MMTKDQRHALYHRLTVGCRVGYAAGFLRSIGAATEPDLCARRGTLREVGLMGGEIVRVEWDDMGEEESGRCHRSAVANVESVAFAD